MLILEEKGYQKYARKAPARQRLPNLSTITLVDLSGNLWQSLASLDKVNEKVTRTAPCRQAHTSSLPWTQSFPSFLNMLLTLY